MVERQVVQREAEQPAAARRFLNAQRAQQRRTGQVEAVVAGVELRGQVAEGGARGALFLEHQVHVAPDHLHRLRQALPGEAGAQHVVARHHLPQGTDEGMQFDSGGEGQHHRCEVRVALALQQVVEQQALLQRGERVDVLHPRCADWCDQGVDLRLCQRQHRQHLGRDACRAVGDGGWRRGDHVGHRVGINAARRGPMPRASAARTAR